MEVHRTSNQEIVYEGWLIKSPPTKLWRARWRERWFTLRHSGELPGQYFLEYYADKKCRKLKGKIDLDQCEQVDAGLRFENRKQKYQFMFNVKTPKRTYYLVAQNEADMNKWVDAVCQVCGLKAQDDEQQLYPFESQESPPVSPLSTVSGPYIPISECISGRSLNDTSSLSSAFGQNQEYYDAPRKLAHPPSPPRSPTTTDAESVLTDDEWTAPVPSVDWENLQASDSKQPDSACDGDIGFWSVRKRFGKLKIVDSAVPPTSEDIPIPPRPPKPAHMSLDNPGHNYLNLDGATESSKPVTPGTPAPQTPATAVLTDETYDFPRSHQPGNDSTLGRKPRHCYSNAAPASATATDDRIFRYDFDEISSPHTETSATATYTNLPSPSIKSEVAAAGITSCSTPQPQALTTTMAPPPVVYRELKPGRKTSDTLSMISNEPSPGPLTGEISSAEHSPAEPPSINRKLKPSFSKMSHESPLKLASPPGRSRMRAAPSPTPPNRHHSSSDDDNAFEDKEEIYYFQEQNSFIPASSRKFIDLQYLDLDLGDESSTASTLPPPAQSPPSSTVYKTVDFLKTEAFNRTRQKVEEERKQCTDS